ncbi:hypothetical protein [Streptomyces sp. W4I9-2]|uniref:hypothetical protein n=1 Tax=Streptomyces sp. W4I9-2 TaxID=3042297 RepID=UPI00278646D8|nr:hypothetical protein [Streptomyces sp. W4I9-2]MDQ0694166.1 hypothetical protein [Streptomyces sp. W4I9-2]
MIKPDLNGTARAMRQLRHCYELGESVERPGIIDATQAATTHMAGLMEQLHNLRADRLVELTHTRRTP